MDEASRTGHTGTKELGGGDPVVRKQTDDAAGELLATYLQHVARSTHGRRPSSEEIVIVLPERADVVERSSDAGATEITLRIKTATS